MSDSEKLKPLFERGISRTIPEQVQYGYLTLLLHLESLMAEVHQMRNDSPGDQDLQRIQDRLVAIFSKNVRLRQKLQYGNAST